jgi:lysine decarboxylase
LLERDGERLLGHLLRLVEHARERLRVVPGLTLLADVVDPGVLLDRTKLAINVSALGASGLAMEEDLIGAGTPVELADRDTLIPVISMSDDFETVDRFLVDGTAGDRHATTRRILRSASHRVGRGGDRSGFGGARCTVPARDPRARTW